ncbi:E3 ubiquitin-protein ligase TRIM39-like [Lissotriton helveticus]
MAAAAQFTNLKDEATCSICLEYYTDPVSTDCGHNFCRACITRCLKERGRSFPCPQCRQSSPGRGLRANRQLGNMVEMVKQLHLPPGRAPGETLCQKHEEKLRLFCEEDQTVICVVCRESRDHKSHSVSPIEEAAEEYKVKLQDWLCPLRKELGHFMESKLKEEKQYNTLRNKVRAEKQNIVSEIEKLRQLLRDKGQTLYRRLEEVEKNIAIAENASISKLSNEITSLNALITDLEKKCKEPALDLLKDARSTLNRCNKVKFQGSEQETKKREEKAPDNESLKTLKPEEEMKKYKVMVTLDPDTAHPKLHLSEKGKCVTRTSTEQPLKFTPKRFTSSYTCVLGSEGFTSGRHYWEVQLLREEKGGWILGVAAESVDRKGRITWSPDGGVWAIQGGKDQYWALTSTEIPLSPREKPLKVGVYLDYEGGRLSLYNADSMELLYSFPRTSFKHRLFPLFYLHWGGELRLV